MFESILFGGGTGLGESILLKFAENKYGIIDSFINSKTNNPQVLDYIIEHKISPDNIDFVVLTHYHQDHFRGIAKILEYCPNARFFCPNVITIKSFQALISAYSKTIQPQRNYFKEYIDIFNTLKSTGRKVFTLTDQSSPIVDNDIVKIYALSPNQATYTFCEELYTQRAKKYFENKNVSISLSQGFNYQSVVIVVEVNGFAFLYGSDLEFHERNMNIGWDEVLNDERLENLNFSIFKIPHHGSENGFKEPQMRPFINEESIFKLTRYAKGRKLLPSDEMVDLLKSVSDNVYITSQTKYEKLPNLIAKKVKEQGLNIQRRRNSMGAVFISLDTEGVIQVDLLGDAYKL